MKHLYFFTLAALTFNLGWGQDRRPTPYSWLPEELPNPQVNPKQCGLERKKGYICDPNHILTRHELKTLDWFLQGIANTKNPYRCPCSQYHCDSFDGPSFYKVAIALVPSLRLPLNTNGQEVSALDQAQTFAYRLEHDLWNMSSCREDIVVLYSRDDQALVTMTGEIAGRKLDPYSRSVIHSIVGQHFADGRINEGLLRMVHEIKHVLYGNNYYQTMAQAQTAGSASRVGPWSLHLVLLALLACVATRFLQSS